MKDETRIIIDGIDRARIVQSLELGTYNINETQELVAFIYRHICSGYSPLPARLAGCSDDDVKDTCLIEALGEMLENLKYWENQRRKHLEDVRSKEFA